jgi:hypothetical protein
MHVALGRAMSATRRRALRGKSIWVERTVAAMLSISGAGAACGGRVDGTNDDGTRSPVPSATNRPPSTTTEPPSPPPTTPTAHPTWTTCGEGGDRMRDDFCGHALRQVPCELTADLPDGGALPSVIDEKLCDRFCWDPNDRCATSRSDDGVDAGRACKEISHVSCRVGYGQNGALWLSCNDECPGGRRPDGYGGEPSDAATPLGRFFARLAQLETVSIGAFGALARDLERHRAPRALVDRALDARKDEVRHARATWRLARRFGARSTRLEHMPRPTAKTILELALENAVEGCVREAYGAVVARHQAERAEDPEIAAVMRDIAVDEAEHAELAWAMHGFFVEQLDETERATVTRALDDAVSDLSRDVARAESVPELTSRAGLPSRSAALAGLASLREHVRDASSRGVKTTAPS